MRFCTEKQSQTLPVHKSGVCSSKRRNSHPPHHWPDAEPVDDRRGVRRVAGTPRGVPSKVRQARVAAAKPGSHRAPRPFVVRAPSVVVVVVVVGREGPRARRAPVPRRALVAPVQGQGRALSAPGRRGQTAEHRERARRHRGRREGRSRARRPPRDVELPVQQRLVRGVRRDHRTRARSLDRRRDPHERRRDRERGHERRRRRRRRGRGGGIGGDALGGCGQAESRPRRRQHPGAVRDDRRAVQHVLRVRLRRDVAREAPKDPPIRHRHPRGDHVQGERHPSPGDGAHRRGHRGRPSGRRDLFRYQVPGTGDGVREQGRGDHGVPRGVQHGHRAAALGAAAAREGG